VAPDAVDLLLTSELMRGVTEEQLRAIEPAPAWLSMAAGETLIREGEPGEAFYLLVQGRLRAFVRDGDRQRRVGEVLPGEGVGEMSLMTTDLTSATVRVMHDSSLIRFSRESYLQLMESCPEAALQVMRTVIRRLRQGIAPPRHSTFATIAVVPLDPTIDAAAFSAVLVAQIGQLRPARHVGLDDLVSVSPEAAPVEVELAGALRQTARLTPEQDHTVSARLDACSRGCDGIVVYEAVAEAIEWTRVAIRQADLVLLVATVDADPAPRPFEEALLGALDADLAPRTDLVLLHPEDWQPTCGAGRWLGCRTISQHHHLRRGQVADLARLARILTGNAISLVLGGGGARGIAQIGALRALRDAGIPIDRVGGTSMGSVIGAFIALGLSVEEITAINREVWLKRRPLKDYTFPALSLLRGRRLHNLTYETFADQQIEDLPISYFCISCDLTASDQIVHDRGLLWHGVRASSSLPGTGPPLFLEGRVLVDGGVINNLPVDVMSTRYGGCVIAVDVSTDQKMEVEPDAEQAPSGWKILWRRLNPFQSPLKLPSIVEILYRTGTLGANRSDSRSRDLADLVITPPVGHIGTLDFKPFDAIIEAGYRDTVRALEATTDPRLTRYLQHQPRQNAPIASDAAARPGPPHQPVAAMMPMDRS